MAKAVIKEIVLVILILAIIVLLFGIVFYDFIPSGKVIPSVISYQTPENVKNELSDFSSDLGSQNVVVSYSIDGQDLSVYEQSNDYSKGKQNPFGKSTGQAAASNTATNLSNTASTNNSTSGNQNKNTSTNQSAQQAQTNSSSSEGTFYKNTGMK